MEKRSTSVDMIALKNKDDDEPTHTGTGCGLLPRKKVNLTKQVKLQKSITFLFIYVSTIFQSSSG